MHDVLERTANDVKGLTKHFVIVQTQLEQITKVQKDLLAETFKKDDKHAFGIATRGGASTQDPLYLAETFKKDDKHAFGIATRGGVNYALERCKSLYLSSLIPPPPMSACRK